MSQLGKLAAQAVKSVKMAAVSAVRHYPRFARSLSRSETCFEEGAKR
jgi:hypothetical protein